MTIQRVKNEAVWQHVRVLFLGSALLFLANIYFGFDNALSVGAIPRWQALVHVHAGTLGWVTLSVFALAFWIHTGDREVSQSYVRRVRTLARISIASFGGYIVAFGLSFAYGRPYTYLLPVFGISSSVMIWAVAIYALSQLRNQITITSVHLLVTAGLGAAALGSTMGVLLGMEYLVGNFLPGDRIGAHAGVMDGYLLLIAATVIEWFMRKEPNSRWSAAGLAQTLAWLTYTILAIPALLFNIQPLIMLATPLLLIGLVLMVVRVGRKALAVNPLGRGPRRWIFFGTIWTIFWALFFMWLISSFADDFTAIPRWAFVVFAHSAFVGMMTNLLLGVHSQRSRARSEVLSWAETAAMWLLNLGLLAFFGLKVTSDSRLGAIVMGVGVLLGVGTMIVRLRTPAPGMVEEGAAAH